MQVDSFCDFLKVKRRCLSRGIDQKPFLFSGCSCRLATKAKMADTDIPLLSQPESYGEGSQSMSESTGEGNTEPRLMISKIVCENFKSYAGVKELGPFHKVHFALRHR